MLCSDFWVLNNRFESLSPDIHTPNSTDSTETATTPDLEPWADTPNALRNALIEIGDLRTENHALHERIKVLLARVKEASAARGEPDPDLKDS
jgi:hypothetical protein